MRGDQLARQWQLIQRLGKSRAGLGLAQLVEELGCVRRTVYRDLDALMYAGFPVVSEKRDGKVYYRFLDSFKLGNVPFTTDEILARDAHLFENEPLSGHTKGLPRSIVVNGKSDSSTYFDRETLRLSAHLPALFGVLPKRVLVIGLGTGVTAGELTLYPGIERIRVVEIS